MENEVKKVDPRKRVEVSGFRLDPDGKSKTKSIQYSKSETYLTELMDSICKQFFSALHTQSRNEFFNLLKEEEWHQI